MCGISGFFDPLHALNADAYEPILSAMNDSLHHRGPDDRGAWSDAPAGIGLAHRRLAILDLSQEGHQPMRSKSGRYIIVFNGEIYNFRELRAQLDTIGNTPWRGHSDTEVMLEAIEAWGFDKAISKFNGMFALALWDCKTRSISLARDRLGKKPLYYTIENNALIFGSELKALRCVPQFKPSIDRDAVTLHMRYGYIPAPHSIYRGVKKLTAGSIAHIKLESGVLESAVTRYWSPPTFYDNKGMGAHVTYEDALGELEALLIDAVKLRTIADVPLGVFLSGGIDSSLITALMQRHSETKVRTFSIGFGPKRFNEAPYAAAIAEHLGTDHTELYASGEDALDLVSQLPEIYDEPFADPSQIPTYIVSKLAREHVTVALGGDGGDETFCGYSRYFAGEQRWSGLQRVPLGLRKAAAGMLRAMPEGLWTSIAHLTGDKRSGQGASSPLPTRVHGLAELLSLASPGDVGRFMMSYWREPERVVLGGNEPPTVYRDGLPIRAEAVPDLMAVSDMMQYLPDDILVKVDRASMAASLEVRAPLLDYRVVEYALKTPLAWKRKDGSGKAPLRAILEKYVPKPLFDRPKMGFGIPLEEWLRGPLKAWAGDLLTEERLKRDGLFDPDVVRPRWESHSAGAHNWAPHLWNVLTVQAWLDAHHASSEVLS